MELSIVITFVMSSVNGCICACCIATAKGTIKLVHVAVLLKQSALNRSPFFVAAAG